MKFNCDLCGHILTEIDSEHAVCDSCGMEYGPERLAELRAAAQKAAPVQPSDPVPLAPKKPSAATQTKKQEQKSGCGIWFLIIMAVLDLIIGTHGIVAVFCLVIIWIMSRFSKK